MASDNAIQLPNTDKSDAPRSQFWNELHLPSRLIPLERTLSALFHPILILFALVSALLTRGITKGEFFYNNDEMRHAMNGAFFRDAIVDFPLRHPLQYVMQYYAKYPSINFPYWPPLFHFTEGLVFLVFGFSPWASRLTILGYALIAVYFWYRIANRIGPRYRAFLSAVILMSLPFVLFQSRVTMLEVPALATCLGTVYFWLEFLETGRSVDLWALGGFVVAAFLTSQKALFLVFFIGIDFLMERRFKLLKRLDVWLVLFVSLVPVVAWYSLSFHSLLDTRSHVLGAAQGGGGSSYLPHFWGYSFYLVSLWRQLGPVLGCLAVIGIGIAIWRHTFFDRFLLAWIFAGYLCFSLLADKDGRYTIQWIPPLIYMALVALEALLVRKRLAIAGCSALALYFAVNAFRIERPIISGVESAAEFVTSQPQSDIVYFQGSFDRDFIFFVRKFDPQKSHMVIKGKQATLMVSGSFNSRQEFVPDDNAILHMFESFGIRYAVIQDVDGDETPAEKSLFDAVRKVLASDQFELIKTLPITTNQRDILTRQLLVYRYRGEVHRTVDQVTLPVDSIGGRGIRVDLTRLVGRPWPN